MTEHLHTKDNAEAIVAELDAAEDDEWTYRAVATAEGSPWYRIEVYDETGALLGPL